MLNVLTQINELIAKVNPDDYDSVSYGKYFRDLSNLSNMVLESSNKLKEEINKIENTELRLKLLKIFDTC